MPKGLHFSRRRSRITDYRKRLALLKAGIPRAVVRFSNAKVTVQIIDFANEGDKVLASANSNDIATVGWKGSKTNIPASYLSGMMAAKRALKAGVSSAVLDIGRITPRPGGRAFAALKGMIDGGLDIPHSDSSFPEEGRINGSHISEKLPKDFDKVMKKIEGGHK